MSMKRFALLLVGTALVASPVLAQNSKSDESSRSSQSTKQQNASETGLWQASKLIGLNVYNDQNQKIGDIKQLMISKSGNVDEVVVGVGGFLGAGERDVAVKFGQLKWSNEPVRSGTSSNKQTSTTGSNQASNNESGKSSRTYPDHAVWNTDKNKVQSMPQFNYDK